MIVAALSSGCAHDPWRGIDPRLDAGSLGLEPPPRFVWALTEPRPLRALPSSVVAVPAAVILPTLALSFARVPIQDGRILECRVHSSMLIEPRPPFSGEILR